MSIATGHSAVMAGRLGGVKGAVGKIDFFPTAPWGTRALTKFVLPSLWPQVDLADLTCWDPCSGLRHMADVLQESFKKVLASDVYDYGVGDRVGSFVGLGAIAPPSQRVDFVVGNPPFVLATEFVERALSLAGVGVAMLLRTQFVETAERYDLFGREPFEFMATFAGRLAMLENRWDPEATTATSYSWFVWDRRPGKRGAGRMRVLLIPPDACRAYSRPDDIEMFADRFVEESQERKEKKRQRELSALKKLLAKHGPQTETT